MKQLTTKKAGDAIQYSDGKGKQGIGKIREVAGAVTEITDKAGAIKVIPTRWIRK